MLGGRCFRDCLPSAQSPAASARALRSARSNVRCNGSGTPSKRGSQPQQTVTFRRRFMHRLQPWRKILPGLHRELQTEQVALQKAVLKTARPMQELIRNRRNMLAGLHRPMGLVIFPAYVLGALSGIMGLPGPHWLPAVTGAFIGSTFAVLNRYLNVRVWLTPREPLNVVITGGSKGLGKAVARELLNQGDSVLITSRTDEGVRAAIAELRSEIGPNIKVYGVVCDVADPSSVAVLEERARAVFGARGVDAWLNNAGYSGSFQAFMEAQDHHLEQVVNTNLVGCLLCTRQAIKLFSKQPKGGHLFNIDGAGADGSATPQYAAYGATKAGIVQLTRTLKHELDGTKIKCHVLSPGMILTDLLLEGATTQNKQAFNILAEHPETVAAFLVPRMKSIVAREEHGKYVRFLTWWTALLRFLTAPARINKFFDADGNSLYLPEHERIVGKQAQRAMAWSRRRNHELAAAYSLSLALSVIVMFADANSLWHT